MSKDKDTEAATSLEPGTEDRIWTWILEGKKSFL